MELVRLVTGKKTNPTTHDYLPKINYFNSGLTTWILKGNQDYGIIINLLNLYRTPSCARGAILDTEDSLEIKKTHPFSQET